MEKYSFEISVAEVETLLQTEGTTGLFFNYEKNDKNEVRIIVTAVSGRNINLKQPFVSLKPIGMSESL